jgi:ribonuclease J
VIQTSNGTIAYTGDFRQHGAKCEMTNDFIEKAGDAEPSAVITEATNMTGASVSSEAEVESKLDSIVKQADGIVLAEFANADVDRLNSFFRVAKKKQRCLAISQKQAYLLQALRDDEGLNLPDLRDESILIFRKSKFSRYKWEEQIEKQYPDKVKNAFELSKQQCKVILAMSFYDLEELVDLQPDPGSCYVLSASEPFNEEMEIDYGRLIHWLQHYGLPQYHIHVSGHIMPLQLKSALKDINASTIFPVHTENAELFTKFIRNIKGQKVHTAKGTEYSI